MTLRLALAVLLTWCAILPAGAATPIRIADPWPAQETIGNVRSEDVTFPSATPFSPADLVSHRAVPPATGRGRLYLPADAPHDHSIPAVVMLHGAAGLVAQRGDLYGTQLAAMGVAVLVLDSFGPRADLGTAFTDRLIHITETAVVTDAYAALGYLAARPEIDGKRVVLVGFSYGGMATTYALYRQMAELLAPPGLRFAGHVAFYGPCIGRFADNRTTGAPLLMLYGQDDELMDPKRCAETALDLRLGGSTVDIISYPGAVHQWDGALERRMIGNNLKPCRFEVERDGTIRDLRTMLPMSGPFLRKVELALCVTWHPYPIGRDDAIREKSNRDFGNFLMQVFNRGTEAG
jgi:dienelactone hydrolase